MYPGPDARACQDLPRPPLDLAALEEPLSDPLIEALCAELGHRWRRRTFTPGLTVRSIVYRGLYPDKSIDALLADIAAAQPQCDGPTDSAWCQARDRLPEAVLGRLLDHTAQDVLDRCGGRFHVAGRPVYRFDGTTVSMPDTPELATHFGYAHCQNGASRFPLARVGVWVVAGAEVLVADRLDPYTTSEDAQFRDSWDAVPRGAICLCDRKFGNFYNLAMLPQRGVDLITRLHASRDVNRLIAAGQALGEDDWLVPLELADTQRRQYDEPMLPARLRVRLIRQPIRSRGRQRTLWIVTTLLDPQQYSRKAICTLYHDRWTIETRINSLKTVLAARVLRSQSVAAIRKELLGRMLAYNLVWAVIHQAARRHRVAADRLSFAGAVRTILAFSVALAGLRGPARAEVYDRMLAHVARHRNPYRPGRHEPRLIKRQPTKYPPLQQPRAIARLQA